MLAMAISCSYSATAWLALLTSSSSFTVAFIIPPSIQHPPASVLVNLYQEEGAPYPSGSRKISLVNLSNANSTNNGSSSNIDEVEDIVGGGTLGDIMATNSTMSTTATNNNNVIHDGLVTKEGGELNTRFKGCNFTPMERIALTANGNLQRIFSSYYDSPVHVHVDYCTRRRRRRKKSSNENNNSQQQISGFNYSSLGLYDTHKLTTTQNINNDDCSNNNDDAIWDRIVHIQVHNRTICKATSIIHVQSPSCVQLIEDGSVGLGQMFRYLDKLPTFSLLDAGRQQRSTKDSTSGDDNDIFEGGMWRTYELQCEEMTCLIHEEFSRDAWDHDI